MQNGAFEKKVQELDAKLFKEGLDSLTDRDLQLLMLNSQNRELIVLDKLVSSIRTPFWKQWSLRELSSATVVVLGLLGLVNWDKVVSLLTTIASAAGK